MSVQLKSNLIKFLKVELTHPDDATGSRITPQCICLNCIQTVLSVLHMIESPCAVCNLELGQHKFVEESRE